jgi:co-chaperonin GroES (HSP10)
MRTFAELFPAASAADLARLSELFPNLPCPYDPAGGWVVVQDRSAVQRTKSGLYIPQASQDQDENQETVARIVRVGPVAGYDQIMGQYQPGWPWYAPGDIVLCPKYSHTRFKVPEGDSAANFRLLPYQDVFGRILRIEQVIR